METVNGNCATLSNYEVFVHLQKLKDSKKKQTGQLATITYETLRYLEGTACTQQSPNAIQNCIKALEPYKFNKTELLMMVNSPPTTALEIQLMVEESEERLTEEQVEEVLQILTNHFPHIRKQEEVQEDAE